MSTWKTPMGRLQNSKQGACKPENREPRNTRTKETG